MATQEAAFKYSNRVLLKTLFERRDELIGQRVIVGGWVKSSKEVQKPLTPPTTPPLVDDTDDDKKTKDVSCVEILQSRIPFIRNIFDVFGGSGYNTSRKKRDSVPPKPVPPKPTIAYLQLTDGSCVASLQVVVDSSVAIPSNLLPTGTSLLVEGQLEQLSPQGKHVIKLTAEKVLHIGKVDSDKYPLSKKLVPLEMLRDYSQFRHRTTTVATVMRIRSAMSFATHSFFNNHGFFEVQVPIITTTDCEGFSNMFQVTTLDQKAEKKKLNTIHETEGVNLELVKAAAKEKSNQIENLKRTESNREALAAAIQDLRKTNELASQMEAKEKKKLGTLFKEDKEDSSKYFFSCQTYLTVSGRLHLGSYACALGNVYSFGPRFQADKTDSAKHAAEMWMVEVEMAFAQLKDSMNCANDFFKYLCTWVFENCFEDMKFVAKRIDHNCINRLMEITSGSPEMMTYNEAIDVLRKVEDKKFETNPESGVVLTSEHLSYLADTIYKKPVMIYNYPKEAKPFYIRLNDDGTVAAFDLVVPKVGTIISGSQNEERLHMISSRINELGLPQEKYEWYLDLRRNGTVKHSGFTLRFDLMVLFITGLTNVRDVIPFPRSYGKANN
ncbi:asparagine--tRNA ligase, cytoplasmic 2 [Gastrolobium bilobum]|uniref:asparagine--tRNA ligase, cytoplasmic 2 n=1 Tax=Gastrolobium bilobum TaxID=150636 RepID=UPI002AAFAD15|nr:asparagine--tRNA ligase, cytoplasmic 2 [Gastrolobium bilobum]